MELKQLRYFIGVVDAGSLLKASSRLHIAQPALGQQITALEVELGVQLFDRSTRGMTITKEGEIFLSHAKVVLTDADRAKEAVRSSNTSPQGEVILGLPPTIALAATVPIVQACRTRFPKIQLQVIEAYSGFLKEWLQMGRLDLALLFGDEPDHQLLKHALLEDRLALVSAPGKSHMPKTIRLRQMADFEFVLPSKEHGLRKIIDEVCLQQGLQLKVIAEIDSLTSVKKAVATGIGSTLLSQSSVIEEVESGALRSALVSDTAMMRRVVCATSITRPTTKASAAVMDLATEIIHGMVNSGIWPAKWLGESGNDRRLRTS